MNRMTLVAVVATTALPLIAEINRPSEDDLKLIERPYESLTASEKVRRNEARRLRELIANGGMIDYPGTPSGTIRFVNLQRRIPSSDLAKVLQFFGSLMQYDVKIVDADCEASFKVKVVDEPSAPSLLVAPEEQWAQVNVAKLGDAKTKPQFLAARTRKEMVRAFSFLTAGTTSDLPLFNVIKSPAELDQHAERGFAVDIIMRSKNYMEGVGVVPREQASYRTVLKHGYDIVPTNDYQKAIYEEIGKSRPLKKKVK